MAMIRVSPELISELLFKGLDVEIREAHMAFGGVLKLFVFGKDVPDCVEARVTMHVTQERGCDRWTRVEITAADPPRRRSDDLSEGSLAAIVG